MKENEIEGIKKIEIKVVVLDFVMVYSFCSKVTKMKMWGRRSNCVVVIEFVPDRVDDEVNIWWPNIEGAEIVTFSFKRWVGVSWFL